jgi:hypothetical protein
MKEKMIMKKLVTVFAACAIAGMAMALDSNIVGYQMHNVKAGLNLMGVAWEGVMATDGKIALEDLMDSSLLTPFVIFSDDPVDGDYVDTWIVGDSWGARYFYMDDPILGKGWMDSVTLTPVVGGLDAGQAFWLFLNNDISDFPFKGQVAEGGTIHTLAAGLNLIANPIPRDIVLMDTKVIEFDGITPFVIFSDDPVDGDFIDTWTIGGSWGARYFYMDDPILGKGWMDSVTLDPVTDKLLCGSGFWFFATETGVEVTFKGL